MNDTSSRSHAILQVFIETWYIEKLEEENERGSKQIIKKRHHWKSLMTIVDLAGSERVSKS